MSVAVKRGDLVTISLQGDFGKPRPALVVQADQLAGLDSVVVCPLTSELRDAAYFRVTVEPDRANGLAKLSQVMVDKFAAVPRTKIAQPIGRLNADRMRAVERAMFVVLGLA